MIDRAACVVQGLALGRSRGTRRQQGTYVKDFGRERETVALRVLPAQF